MTGPVIARRIVFPERHRVAVVKEPVPEPGRGQVRIKTRLSLVSIGTELTCLSGEFDDDSRWSRWVRYPFPPGYCNVGVVIDVGPDCPGFAVGDRVATRSKHVQYCLFDAADGTRVHPILKIPEDVRDEQAVWLGIACIAQNGIRQAASALGEDVVVIGAGPIGQLVVRYARLSGARSVTAIDLSDTRLELCRKGGATHTLCRPASSCRDAVRGITGGHMAHVVYDVTGNPAALSAAIELGRSLGKIVLLGDAAFASEQRLSCDVVAKGLTLIGVHDLLRPAVSTVFADWSHASMGELFFAYVARGDMDLAPLITSRSSPVEAPRVYEELTRDRMSEVGVLFDWRDVDRRDHA